MAILLPVVIGAVGLAVDEGRVVLAHSRIQTAVDAAALAGALQLPFDPDISNGLVSSAAHDLATKNSPGIVIESVVPGTEGRSVCVTGRVNVNLTFMRVLGLSTQSVRATSCAGFNNLEVAIVIDYSGSMNGTPMTKTREAALDLVDLVIPDSGAASSKVGIVPFRGKIRLNAGVDGLAAGCRNADGTLQSKDPSFTPPKTSTAFTESCTKGLQPITPLTTDKTVLINAINQLTAPSSYTSGTIISEGIKWGAQVLTPDAPFTQGGDPKKYHKVMILLTDGDNEDGKCGGSYAASSDPNAYWYNAYYPMGTKTCHCENNGCLDTAMKTEATKAKNNSIEIFTVRFGTSDSNDIALMKLVASSKTGTTDHYFDAPTADDIKVMFKKIGQQLGWRLLR